MLINHRPRRTPFTNGRLYHTYLLVSSWELDECRNIREYFPPLGIIQTMGASGGLYNPLFNLKRKTRVILDEFTFNLVE